MFFVFLFVRFCLAIAEMPSRNCQWLHSSDIAIANVPSRNCQCMCKRTVKKLHSEGVPFCFNLILGGLPPWTLNKYHLIMNATHYLGVRLVLGSRDYVWTCGQMTSLDSFGGFNLRWNGRNFSHLRSPQQLSRTDTLAWPPYSLQRNIGFYRILADLWSGNVKITYHKSTNEHVIACNWLVTTNALVEWEMLRT